MSAAGVLVGPALAGGPPGAGAAAAGGGASGASGGTAESPGVTPTTITIGQVDDLTLPLSGLFRAAQDGTQAYVDYVNAHGGVDGRRLVLDARDSHFDTATVLAVTRQQARSDFALVGGFSLLDQAEGPIVSQYRVPDVDDPLSNELAANRNVYSPAPSAINATPTGPYLWARHTFPVQSRHIGILYSAATPGSVTDELAFDRVMTEVGLRYLYRRGVGALESTFNSDVLKMRDAGVQMFYNQELPGNSAATLAREASLQGYHPVNIESVAAYVANMGQLGGPAAEGMYIPMGSVLYQGQDAAAVPAVRVFDTWAKRVDPKVFSAVIPAVALYGWASAALFVQALRAAGPHPTRAGLRAQLNEITSFDADGLLPPGENPAGNLPSRCFLLVRFLHGDWRRVSPSPRRGFICTGSLRLRQGWHPEAR